MKKIVETIDNEDYDIVILNNEEFNEVDGDNDKVRRIYGDKSIVVKLEENGQRTTMPSSALSENEETQLKRIVDDKFNKF